MSKTHRSVGFALLLLAVPYAHPRLARFRIAATPWQHEEIKKTAEVASAPAPTVGETLLAAAQNRSSVANALPASQDSPKGIEPVRSVAVPIENLEAMDAFFAKLAETTKPGSKAVTRILHYGDSVITSDYVSGTMRRKMQASFGDAGHGFILLANGWEWYFHNDVTHQSSEGWHANRVSGPFAKDGRYGLGGVVFRGTPGATATFGTATHGDYGRKASRYDFYYLQQPKGGEVELRVQGREPEVFTTRGEETVSKVHSVTLDDGENKVVLRVLGKGDVTLYGTAIERDVAGVVYDALGALAARATMWNGMDADHWKEQLALRDPSLIVVQLGTNESEDGLVKEEEYEKNLGDLIDKIKIAAPKASLLIASPLDRAEKSPSGGYRSVHALRRIVTFQERVAKSRNVAFWNTWKAMGGDGSMGKWLLAKPQLASSDLTHPTPAGAEVIGGLLHKAVLAGFDEWRRNRAK